MTIEEANEEIKKFDDEEYIDIYSADRVMLDGYFRYSTIRKLVSIMEDIDGRE